jgi:hypothetical protein
MATNYEAAMEYVQRGWLVFPLHYAVSKGKCSCSQPDCQSPAKHPMTKQGLKDASKDHKQIKEWWTRNPQANIGICTGEESGLVVIDIDPRHGGMESMKSIGKLGSLPVMTPTVATGGGGEHIYLSYPNNGRRIRNTVALAGYQGIDLRGDGGYVVAPPSRHISGSKYTWKVHHIGKTPAKIPEWFIELTNRPVRTLVPPQRGTVIIDKISSSREGCNGSVTEVPEGTRDNAIFNLAKTLRKGGMEFEETCYHVVLFAKNCCSPPISEKVAIEKVRSTWQEERNLTAEIRNFLAVTKGVFTLRDVKDELHIVTEKEKTLLRVTLHRLSQANVLERIENRPGYFRIVEGILETMVLTDDEDDIPLDITWPFGLENLVDIMPKNIAIVAGVKDAGKSAFCLNAAKMNMHKWDVHYFSSEMDVVELKRRLRRFRDLKISDWKFKPHPRASKFADVIFPEAFNIIDYLEISKDFSMVAEDIRQIYDKLTTGVCLIALQKDKDAEFGRGKSFSLEKARMYLTLDRQQYNNILTIRSGKNWHQEGFNPVGTIIKYKIINGATLLEYE